MNKSLIYKLFFTIITWLPLLFENVPFFLFARSSAITNSELSVPEATGSRCYLCPQLSVININNVAYWVSKDGSGTTSGSPNGTQSDYPIFTGGMVYLDGMLWGVKTNEYPEGSPVRVGGSTYYKGMKAGRVIYNSNGTVAGADDPVNNHVWRVRRDYVTADLSADVANFFATPIASITPEQTLDVFNQYTYDWNNWPTDWGAPYEDVDGNGAYDPTVDIPGYPGADQTLWTISNDVPTIVDETGTPIDTINTAQNLYGSEPVGVELRLTMWAYKLESDKPLGNAVYKKTQLTYTGFEEESEYINPEVLDTVYFTQWSDPDVGTYTDDFVGCDIDLSLAFFYNGDDNDGVFNEIYDMPAPAGGYDFLKSPEDENGIELGMTAFTYFGAGAEISDPDLSMYSGSLQFFNLMEGYLPRPEYPNQIPFIDPITMEETKFALPGDPATGQGWIDGIDLSPGDRRIVMSSGPFSMNKGQSQEIIVALIGAQRLNPIESLRKLKKDDESIQIAYDTDFNLLDYNVNVYPEIDIGFGAVVCSLSVDVSDAVAFVNATLDNGSGSMIDLVLNPSNGYSIQTELAENPIPYTLSLAVFLSTGASYSLDSLAQKALTWNPINVSGHQVIYDNLSNDGALNIGDMAHIAFTMSNNSDREIEELVAMALNVYGPVEYYEDPYLSFGNIIPYGSSSSSMFTEDNSHVKIKVSESAQEGDTLEVAIRFFDSIGNIWEIEYELYIQGNEGMTDFTGPDHIEGSADGNFAYRVVRPFDITGHEYQISFSEYIHGSLTRSAGKVVDCSGTSVSGYAVLSSTPGTIDLVFDNHLYCPGGDWVDGIEYTFPTGFSSYVNSWEFTSGDICSYGNGQGQNCDNLGGTWLDDVLIFGNNMGSDFGAFEGSNVLTINVNPWFSGDFESVSVGYVIYDDGYSGTLINSEGEFEITDYWEYGPNTILMDIVDLTDQELILSTDIYPNEEGTNIDIIDGFKLFKGSVIYGSAEDFNDIIYAFDAPCWDPANRPCFQEWVDGYYDIDSYAHNNWAPTARAIDTWGAGTTSPGILGRDVQIRFTGVYGAPVEISGGGVYVPVESGGSLAWIDGARVSDLASHPDANNPGDGSPFHIRIPFEVWDIEHPSGPRQIDVTIYDRIQPYNGSADTVWAFNPYNRMYTHFIMEDYATSSLATEISEDSLTWNLVWWETQWVAGDTIIIEYLTPVSTEDRYLFTPATGSFRHISDVIPDGYNLVQNYPNPFNPTTKIDYGLPEASNVRLIIYDILGREVITLVNGMQEPGYKSITWNGKNAFGNNVGAGMYFYQIKAGEFMQVKKMVLLK